MNFIQITNSAELGIIYGLVAIAVYLSFRIVNFADLTVDGTFALGAAICASLIEKGTSIALSALIAFLGGAIAGVVTAYLNVRYKIMEILAGILTATALYSINMRIMKKPNISLTSLELSEQQIFLIIFITVIIITSLIIILLKTDFGLSLRCCGQNENFALNNSINIDAMKIFVISVSNALVALSGALLVLMQGFADISMGFGTIIIGLISVIIGERISANKSISLMILALILGSIIYRMVVTISLNLEILKLEATDLNLISAILVAILMISPLYLNRVKFK